MMAVSPVWNWSSPDLSGAFFSRAAMLLPPEESPAYD